jgi:RimJ/RimL family protein N-acetyltransferase
MVLKTQRLVLRPVRLADVDEVLALHADPEVKRFIGSLDRMGVRERLELAAAEWAERGHGMFAVSDRVTKEFLGRVALKYWPQFDETEVGWVLRHDARRQGYATEAGRACIDWGFRQLPTPYLTAMIQPENAASIRVAERLGWHRCARMCCLALRSWCMRSAVGTGSRNAGEPMASSRDLRASAFP